MVDPLHTARKGENHGAHAAGTSAAGDGLCDRGGPAARGARRAGAGGADDEARAPRPRGRSRRRGGGRLVDRSVREGRPGRGRSARRRRRRRPRRPHLRLPARAGRDRRAGLRGAPDAGRRALLDRPHELGRSDHRARRRAHRPGAHGDAPARPGARLQARQPAPGRAERNGGLLPVRRRALHVRAGDDRPQRHLPEDAQGRLGRQLPDALEQLHAARLRARPHVDHRLARRDVSERRRELRSSASSSTSPTTSSTAPSAACRAR